MTTTLPSQTVINRTLGPIFAGLWLQSFFLGMVILQATRYSTSAQRFSNPNAEKSHHVVWALLVLSTLGHFAYRSTVAYFGDYSHFDQATWTLWAEPAVTAMVGALTHLFFLERCWLATNKSRTTCALLFLLLLLSLGSGIAVSVSLFHVKLVGKMSTIPLPMGLWLCASAVTNIIIGAILSLEFIQNKRQLDVADKIIQFTVENGAVSAAVAMLNLVLYFAMKNTTYHFLAEFTLPYMYTLTVLVTLLAPGASGSHLSSFTLSGPVKERTVMEVKVSRVVESDIPDRDGSITKPKNANDNKLIWSHAV
ncbi:hypothetical protein C8F04DRAFT_1406657 [Mycena alexandri]|uniref:DUF6534 domain-containing protein n=1 Tax=Mycena alexandri TaxID=1745969 RepID=A0AAD6RXA7_9AGAR|nr:hypothetical protein C8F04DRAFT_1406657 [Mycena alexandri]